TRGSHTSWASGTLLHFAQERIAFRCRVSDPCSSSPLDFRMHGISGRVFSMTFPSFLLDRMVTSRGILQCQNCQRQTGSAFVINLLIEADRVELLAGAPQPVDVPRDDGSTQRIFRCPICQVAVFSQYGRPEVHFVRAGTLDDPSRVSP